MPFRRTLALVNAWIPGPGEPTNPPVDPGYGVEAPVDPSYGRPDWGGRPDNSLPGGGHVSGGPIKPPGRPILPPSVDNGLPPSGAHPWLPGHWEPIDPGYGKPPIWGWMPVDPGFGVGGGGGSTLPESPGHWVPVDPDYGKPVGPCGGHDPIPHPPLWAWIPEIGPDFGLKPDNALPPVAAPKK